MNFIKRIFCQIILIADDKPSIVEKITYFFSVVVTFTPIAYLLDGLNLWFRTNAQFSSFVPICLLINMAVGVRYHMKMQTFSWMEFFKRNSEMWLVIVVVYGLLEMMRLTAGNNYIGEGFKIMIQVMTLLYPVSKALKNIYILTHKKYPPSFIMEKLYNWEKNGNVKELFNNDKKEE